MIEYAKIKYVHKVALVILGGLLTVGHHAIAQPADATVNPANALVDTPKDSSGATVGTAVGNAPAVGNAAIPADQANTTDQTASDQAAQDKSHTLSATAAKILDAISKHPTGREARRANWKIDQDNAVLAARNGQYDQALPVLDRLHKDHPDDFSIAADRAAILAWAGRDADAVAAYKEVQAMPHTDALPDYLIDAIGHSYRNLHQPEDALAVYRIGLQANPENQSYQAGEILSLLEANHMEEAVARAQEAQEKYPAPDAPLLLAIKTTLRANAVQMARAAHYTEALVAFASLHQKYPDDTDITGDYVAVLSWAGKDADAVKLFATLPQDNQPDYILDAAAHSYRNLHQPKKALDLYQAALDKSPDNVTYAVGVIYSLSDLGRSDEALKIATEQLQKHPEKPDALVKAYTYVERRRAIDLARAGHYEQALALLRQLRAKYPNDASEVMDYIAVSSWAGHDSDAVKQYQKIAREKMPDYVLEAVGKSYRALTQPEKALAVYRRGLKQSPRNEIFAAGEIRCLDDLGRYAEGEDRAKFYMRSYGDHIEVLLAGGEAANFNDDTTQSLNFYERANALSGNNHEALRGLIHAEDRVGAPQLALALAAKHPGLMKGDEYRAIVGDEDEHLVRWGTLEPASEATRYAETDKALAILDDNIATWTAKDDASYYPDIMRARFDRLIALRDRSRMQEVVDSYNQLVQEGVDVPGYALVPVGEAYLYLRQPEIARDIFLKVLETDPNNFEARHLLTYAYLESEQYDEAFATADKMVADEPKWIYLKGEPEQQPNPQRMMAEVQAAQVRGFADMPQDASDRLTPITDAAPYDARNRDAAGNLDMIRGWPRAALQEHQIGLAIQNGRDMPNEVGIAMANLDLQNFRATESEMQSLTQRFPESLDVQRAQRLWEVHNMAEVDVRAGYAFAPSESSTAVNSPHGQGYDVGAELYSSPIDYNWRLFAGQDWEHEHEPSAEGIVDYERSNAGVEYRNGDITATLAPTFNHYTSSTTANGVNADRLGADGTFKYTFNDIWSAGIAAELFAADTPLRALNAGVTADQYSGNVVWRPSEERSATLTVAAMPFSDGNFRTLQDGEYIQRLYTDPWWQLDAEGNLGLSQDSKNENRLYYNPSMDLTGLAGLKLTNFIYRHYETLYEQSLLTMPGLYAQQHYGTSPAWTVRYEQRVHYDDTLNAGAGVNYTHQDYDGSAQDAVSLTVDVVERF